MADKWIFRMRMAAIAQSSPNQARDRTWITDVRIISPEKLDHIEMIENGRIVRSSEKQERRSLPAQR
jgi:hypothetical protein